MRFDFDFYGQALEEIVITSAGAILTGNKDDVIHMPNHIAPFLSNLPPSDRDEVTYINEGESQKNICVMLYD